jgi:hypothetical protein
MYVLRATLPAPALNRSNTSEKLGKPCCDRTQRLSNLWRCVSGQVLASTTPNHRDLRAFALLGEREIADLQTLAKQVNGRAITSASDAAAHLRVILDMVQTAKGINEAMGWIPTTAETGRWKKAIEGAHRALQEIETACAAQTEFLSGVPEKNDRLDGFPTRQ